MSGSLHNGHLWLNPEDNTLYGRDTADDEWQVIGVMGAGVPTLAAVLAEGNDTGGTNIAASENLQIVGADGGEGIAGKSVQIVGGYGDAFGGVPAYVTAEGGHADGTPGYLVLTTKGVSADIPGQVITAGYDTEAGYAVWADPATGAAEIVITEDASGAAGTYTGSVTVPGGATMTPRTCSLTWVADWSYNPAVSISLGDTDNPAGWIDGGSSNDFSGEGDTVALGHWTSIPYLSGDHGKNYSATDREIIATVVVNDTNPPGTGVLRILITWAKPTPVAATFEAAP